MVMVEREEESCCNPPSCSGSCQLTGGGGWKKVIAFNSVVTGWWNWTRVIGSDFLSNFTFTDCLEHRRRIKTEEKAKVVTAVLVDSSIYATL